MADKFKVDCERIGQTADFSGVGTQHQNGIAERNIKTVASWARANMLHVAYHWPQHASIKLWPMAINYAVWVFNHLPRADTGLCPDEMWSQCRTTHDDLRRAHVWGCPVYVLEPALQDGKKIPKWQSRARLGMFVGFSQVHSSLVPLVLNVATGKISPQYHVVFDDTFSTVNLLPTEDSIEDGLQELMELDLIDRLGFGAIRCLKDGVGDGTSDLLLDSIDDTFLGINDRQSCDVLAVHLFSRIGQGFDFGLGIFVFASV